MLGFFFFIFESLSWLSLLKMHWCTCLGWIAFTWVEARLGMYGWHQFSMAGMFTTVAEEEFKFNLHPFQRRQRNARERTPGLRPVLLSSTQPYWEVHPGSEHPTVGLSWFILTHCKLYEASSGPETSDFRIRLSWEFSAFFLLSTRGDAIRAFNIILYEICPHHSRLSQSLPELHEAPGILILVCPPRLDLHEDRSCAFLCPAPGRHSASYKAETQ